MRETNEVVKCPICNQYCPEPEESYGYTSLSAARAGVKKKHWQSVCALVDNEDHKEAQILWERLHGCCAYWRAGVTWTNSEEKDFLSRLETIRSKINDELPVAFHTRSRSSQKKQQRKPAGGSGGTDTQV